MKIRYIVAGVLSILAFMTTVVGFGLTAIYCKQEFYGRSVPIICADTQPGTSTLVKVVMYALGWVSLAALPIITGLAYARFGWPHARQKPPLQENTK